MERLMRERGPLPWPAFYYWLCLDLFALVQFWAPDLRGARRGRAFERLFCDYCRAQRIPMSEQPGSRSLRGARSASGFLHEQDAVLCLPEATFHIELKHWSEPLQKNELLIFAQKGLDYLMGAGPAVRARPLHRIVLSGSVLRPEARRFALQWGIATVEPDRLPLLVLHYAAACRLDAQGFPRERVWEDVPRWLTSVQDTMRRTARVLDGELPARLSIEEDAILVDLQRNGGDACWDALDRTLGSDWLELRYERLVEGNNLL